MFNDPKLAGRYGVLKSDDWNVFDIFLVAGINPFKEHSEEEMNTFKDTAIKVFKDAKVVSDMAGLNQDLISGEIDLYLTGVNASHLLDRPRSVSGSSRHLFAQQVARGKRDGSVRVPLGPERSGGYGRDGLPVYGGRPFGTAAPAAWRCWRRSAGPRRG